MKFLEEGVVVECLFRQGKKKTTILYRATIRSGIRAPCYNVPVKFHHKPFTEQEIPIEWIAQATLKPPLNGKKDVKLELAETKAEKAIRMEKGETKMLRQVTKDSRMELIQKYGLVANAKIVCRRNEKEGKELCGTKLNTGTVHKVNRDHVYACFSISDECTLAEGDRVYSMRTLEFKSNDTGTSDSDEITYTAEQFTRGKVVATEDGKVKVRWSKDTEDRLMEQTDLGERLKIQCSWIKQIEDEGIYKDFHWDVDRRVTSEMAKRRRFDMKMVAHKLAVGDKVKCYYVVTKNKDGKSEEPSEAMILRIHFSEVEVQFHSGVPPKTIPCQWVAK